MAIQRFSQRQGFAPEPLPLAFDDLPDWVRDDFPGLVHRCTQRWYRPQYSPDQFADDLYLLLSPYVKQLLGTSPRGFPKGDALQYYIAEVFRRCAWWQFYDICEAIHRLIRATYGTRSTLDLISGKKGRPHLAAKAFSEEVNALFSSERLTWRLRNGHIEREYSQPVSDTLKKTHTLLRDQRFQGPDEQFRKATSFLSQRPEPDVGNCVKEATGALEGVARILSGDLDATLGAILSTHFKSRIPGALYKTYEGIWGYASNAPGARHARVGSARITIEEAELVLTTCAGMIIYLANKLGSQEP